MKKKPNRRRQIGLLASSGLPAYWGNRWCYSRPRRTVKHLGFCLMTALALDPGTGTAAVFNWNAAPNTVAPFQTPGNWSPAGPPGVSDSAVWALPQINTVTFGGNTTNQTLAIDGNALLVFTPSTTVPNGAAITYKLASTTTEDLLRQGSLTLQGQTNNRTLELQFANTVKLGLDPGDDFRLMVNTGAKLTQTGGSMIIGDGISANTATASVTLKGGTASTFDDLIIGNWWNTQGAVVIDGVGSAWTVGDQVVLGKEHGDGKLNIWNGGTLTNQGRGLVGLYGFQNTVEIDGIGSTWDIGADLEAGHVGKGTIDITRGGRVTSVGGSIGVEPSGNFTITVEGKQSWWDATTGGLSVGINGVGVLNVSNQGKVTANQMVVGDGTIGHGSVNVSRDGSVLAIANDLVIGDATDGSMNVTNGASVTSNTGVLGRAELQGVSTWWSGAGTVVVDGINSNWTIASQLTVGSFGGGMGSLTVQNGGTVSNAGAVIGDIGHSFAPVVRPTTTGTVTVKGANSVWNNGGTLVIGKGGAATLNLEAAGHVVNPNAFVAAEETAQGTVNLSGVGTTWETTGSLYLGGTNVAPGGNGSVVAADNTVIQVANLTKVWYQGALHLQGGHLTTRSFQNLNSIVSFNDQFDDGILTVDGGNFDSGAASLVLDGVSVGDNPTLQLINNATESSLTGNLTIGDAVAGTLELRSGAKISHAGDASIARLAGSLGTAEVADANTSWDITGNLSVGGSATTQGGVGVLTLQPGAVLNVSGKLKVWAQGTLWGNGGQITTTSFENDNVVNPFSSQFHDGTLIVNGGTFDNGISNLILNGADADDLPILRFQNGATDTSVNSVVSLGSSRNAKLEITTGAKLTHNGPAIFGEQAGGNGMATVTGAGSQWTTTETFSVGYNGTGTLDVSAGGTVKSLSGVVGAQPGSHGTVNVLGSNSFWNIGSGLFVGQAGNGVLNIQGGLVSNDDATIGQNFLSQGTVNLTGAGTVWSVNRSLFVGGTDFAAGGTGTINLTAGAKLNVALSTELWADGVINLLGGELTTHHYETRSTASFNSQFDDGILTIDGGTFYDWTSPDLRIDGETATQNPTMRFVNGANSTSVTQTIIVGDAQKAKLTLESGSHLTNNLLGTVGNLVGSTGVVDVTGAGSQWNVGSSLAVGASGNGTLNILSGGRVTSDNAGVAAGSTATGAVTINGTNSAWNVTHDLAIGGSLVATGGTGSLQLQTGGQLSVGGKTKVWGNGTLNLWGGTFTTHSFQNVNTTTPFDEQFDNGTMTVDGGTFDSGAPQLVIDGAVATDNPLLRFINGATETSVTGAVSVGDARRGTWEILSGSQVSHAGDATVGRQAGSSGTVTVSGNASQWATQGNLAIGATGTTASGAPVTGTVNLAPGATIQVNGLTRVWTAGRLNFLGGDLITGSFRYEPRTLSFDDSFDVGVMTVRGGTFDPGTNNLVVNGSNNVQNPTLRLEHGATAPGITGDVSVGIGAGVGVPTRGTLEILSGAKLIHGGTATMGAFSIASQGEATVDGAGSLWQAGTLIVGKQGSSKLTIQNGGTVTNTNAIVSEFGGRGTVVLDGINSVWNVSSQLGVGGSPTSSGNGIGSILVSNNARLQAGSTTLWSGGDIQLDGGTVKSTTQLRLAGGRLKLNSGAVVVGSGAGVSGTIQIEAGASVSSDGGGIVANGADGVFGNPDGASGRSVNSAGTMTIRSANLSANGGSGRTSTVAGRGGNGGNVTIVGGATGLEQTASVNLKGGNGGHSNATLPGTAENGGIGGAGGLFAISGGTTTVSDVSMIDLSGGNGGNAGGSTVAQGGRGGAGGAGGELRITNGQFTMNGGTVRLNGGQGGSGGTGITPGVAGDAGLAGSMRISGGTVDLNSGLITGDATIPVTSPLGLTKSTLNMQAGLLQIHQPIDITQGTFNLIGGVVTADAINFNSGNFNFSGGTLSVDAFHGNLLQMGGVLSPGHSLGSTAIQGDYVEFGGALQIELGGLTTGSYDQVTVSGNATLQGDLQVQLLNAFAPSLGQAWKIVDVAGSRTGAFQGLSEGGFVGNYGGVDLFITYQAGDGNDVGLYTTPLQFQCDLNADQAVDAGDAAILFADWGGSGTGDINRDGITDAADAAVCFAEWTGDGISYATPEPHSLSATCCLVVVHFMRQRRSQKRSV